MQLCVRSCVCFCDGYCQPLFGALIQNGTDKEGDCVDVVCFCVCVVCVPNQGIRNNSKAREILSFLHASRREKMRSVGMARKREKFPSERRVKDGSKPLSACPYMIVSVGARATRQSFGLSGSPRVMHI